MRLSLQGIRVFVVEDEALVLLELLDVLAELGCVVAGSALRLDDAMAKAHDIECDLAVLDVNVAGQRIDEVAHILTRRGIPFLFVSGYERTALPPEFQALPLLTKPYTKATLKNALLACLPEPAA